MSKIATSSVLTLISTLVLVTGLAACVAKPVAEQAAAPAATIPAGVESDARMAPQAPYDQTPITPVESAGASA